MTEDIAGDRPGDIAGEVEAEVAWLSRYLTEPGEHECLRCFLLRMVNEFGCDGTHRWAGRWREVRSPRARALLRRLERLGGFCDCEVLLNVFPDYPDTGRPLPCAGQRQAGSAVPCELRALPRSA
jgi:Protein of unknown function (DUF2695)